MSKVYQRNLTTSSINLNKASKQDLLLQLVRQQQHINTYNNEYVGIKDKHGNRFDKHFENVMLNDECIIVSCFKENYIKQMFFNENGKVKNYSVSRTLIDARHSTSQSLSYTDDPFQTINKGIIIAISDKAKLTLLKQQVELNQLTNSKTPLLIPKVGDVVYLNNFMRKDCRYYTDAHAKSQDYVRSQQDFSLVNFDFLFKLNLHQIESFVPSEKKHLLKDATYQYSNIIDNVNESNITEYFEITDEMTSFDSSLIEAYKYDTFGNKSKSHSITNQFNALE